MKAGANFYRLVQDSLVLIAKMKAHANFFYTSSYDLATYRICEQRKTRRACTFAQSRQSLR